MIIEALLIGAFVGIVVGSLGAGGGILSVPILVYILGQDPHQATGLSLIIVGLTAAVSLATRARSGNVAWREGALFALAGLVGTWAGSALGPLVSARALMLSFCALLGAVAVFMVRSQMRPSASSSSDEAGGAADVQGSWTLATVCRVVALATLTGFLTGFFGVGGGFAIVPALHLALRYPMKRASATSLLVMVITAAFGLASRTLAGTLTITAEAGVMVALFTAASMGGGIVGAKLTKRVSNRVLGLVFAALLVCVAVSTLAATLEVSALPWLPFLLPGPRPPSGGGPGRVLPVSPCSPPGPCWPLPGPC